MASSLISSFIRRETSKTLSPRSGQCQGDVSLCKGYPIDWIPACAGMAKWRGKMLDAELAEMYDVPFKALNQAARRNLERFPSDFMFQFSSSEKAKVVANCGQLAKPLCRGML